MNEDVKEFMGYHGTSRKNVRLIKKTGFNESNTGWLGTGVYFFEEDFELALKWAKKKHNTHEVEFIKKKICVDEKKLFDISWPLAKQTQYYFKERERYMQEMIKRGYEVSVENRKRYENELINLICKTKKYDVVRACTYTYQKYDYIGGKEIDSVFANGIEISVREPNCII